VTALVAVLAGGRGRRMGGAEAVAEFRGEPLIAWPLRAAAGRDAVVIAKAGTALPPLDVPVWVERLATGQEAAVRAGGRLAPFPARYVVSALPALRVSLEREASMRATLAALAPTTFEVDAQLVGSVNTPDELANA
jgi:molybdopterin-guanine dinucleotide biosynthesis protein A